MLVAESCEYEREITEVDGFEAIDAAQPRRSDRAKFRADAVKTVRICTGITQNFSYRLRAG